jgi:hypothetical protein
MRLPESLINSEVSSDQQVQLIEDEDSCGFLSHVNEDDDKLKTFTIQEADLRSLIMIGGIEVFLPLAQEKGKICVADAATTGGQLAETVAEGLEQIFEAAQEGEENEHSEEWLNIFSQKAEEAVASKLTTKEQKRMMSILRNGSIFSARRLKRLQHGSLQKKKKKQKALVWLICMNKSKP